MVWYFGDWNFVSIFVIVMDKTKSTKNRSAKSDSGFRRHSLGLIIGVMAVCAVIGVIAGFAFQSYSGETVWIYVPADATDDAVADTLREHLGSVEANRVKLLWRMQGGTPKSAHGAYKVEHGQRSIVTARRLTKGMQTPVRVSWSNVRTMEQLAERIASRLECTADEFVAACSDVLPQKGYKKEEFPAAFMPDTYEFYWTVSSHDLVQRLSEYRDKFWNDERRKAASRLGLTPVEVATVASIVEEETAKRDEYGNIARLYLNRLKTDMPLQADPTVKFASGDFALRRITGTHLRIASPYNTYRIKGLPPGPIRVASPAGIESVLEAPAHDYIYMCAKEDFSGYHNFAADYATHQANARRYQAELNRRNIR